MTRERKKVVAVGKGVAVEEREKVAIEEGEEVAVWERLGWFGVF